LDLKIEVTGDASCSYLNLISDARLDLATLVKSYFRVTLPDKSMFDLKKVKRVPKNNVGYPDDRNV